ncbi:Glycoside hydrolase, family 28 [Dillenia turbinata]|uniref:endo-polygalacturonase n=1 Tax=Dillenia turbinata TaxID=194707 RepID=A0AAN8ULH0_9MAGN
MNTLYVILVFLCMHLMHAGSFESLLQLPRSKAVRSRTRSRRVISVSSYGAQGNGINDDTQAFQDAWELACMNSSKAEVVIPAGRMYLVRPIDFAGPCRSKVTLRISGTIVAPKDPDVWKGLNPRKWLYFHGVRHLTVEGGGEINGMGAEWWARSCKTNKTNAITFHKCKRLKVRNITLVNSQKMHMAFTSCLGVMASNLKVIAPFASPNTDGIHISATTRIEVKDSTIGTGDDCISIVRNSSQILISNITCGPVVYKGMTAYLSSGILHRSFIGSLGKSNLWENVNDVMVNGAFLSNTQNGVRIKTWQGGSGSATNIVFQNIWMENVSHPIVINQYYCDSRKPCGNQTLAVKVSNITFMSIKGTSATKEAMRFVCSEYCPCEGLYLSDIQLKLHCGGTTKSFCWAAQGSSSGLVHPPPCFSCEGSFLALKVSSVTTLDSI